jgi:signal transduction histidine kinase
VTRSIGHEVAVRGAIVLVLSLAATGLATGIALHRQRVEGLDRALLATLYGRAHPDVPVSWSLEHSRPPADAWVVSGADPRVPDELRRQALKHERPLFSNVGEHRLALMAAEVEDDDEEDDEEDEHDEQRVLLAARALRVTPADSVGAFAMLYTCFASLISIAGALALQSTVRHALAPVHRAREEASAVLGLGDGKRLTTDAPAELHALLVGFNEVLDRLDDAAQAQGRFTAEAAHELRTPVTALLGELDVTLRRERNAEEYRAALLSARDDVGRLRRVVEGLTALARLDAGEADHHRQLIRAADLAQQVLAAERRRPGSEHVRLEILADPELDIHPGLVSLALTNLLRNALLHAPGVETVLRVDQEGEHVVFTVDDAGPGLPDLDPEALFDRFARGARSRVRNPDGLGLGLSIARQVARRHGGDCTVGVSPLGGVRARLTLRLPVA